MIPHRGLRVTVICRVKVTPRGFLPANLDVPLWVLAVLVAGANKAEDKRVVGVTHGHDALCLLDFLDNLLERVGRGNWEHLVHAPGPLLCREGDKAVLRLDFKLK